MSAFALNCGYANLLEVLGVMTTINADVSGLIRGTLAELSAERIRQAVKAYYATMPLFNFTPLAVRLQRIAYISRGFDMTMNYDSYCDTMVVDFTWQSADNSHRDVTSVLMGRPSGELSIKYWIPMRDVANYLKYLGNTLSVSWK